MSYNPNASGTIGPEWFVAASGGVSLGSSSVVAACVVNSTAAETIDKVIIPHLWTGPSSGYGRLFLDVYDLADLPDGSAPPTVSTFVPNEDVECHNLFNSPGWSGPINSTGTEYTRIDETTDGELQYISLTNSYLRMCFNASTFSATAQPNYVEFVVRAMQYYGTSPLMYLDLYYGSGFVSRLGTISPSPGGDDTHFTFNNYTIGPITTNPKTGAPWTAQDIKDFDDPTKYNVRIYGDTNSAVERIQMNVGAGGAVDKRVAIGGTTAVSTLPAGIQTNAFILVGTPAGVDNWAKASSKSYLFVIRRIDLAGSAALTPQILYIDGAACPHNQGAERAATVDSNNILKTVGAATGKTFGVIMANTVGALSVDSQPYYQLTREPVHASSTMKQRLSGFATATYGGARMVIGRLVGETDATPLSVKVKRVSDNVQFGSTLTIADFNSGSSLLGIYNGVQWYDVVAAFSSAPSLVSGTQYYVELTSAATSVHPWYVAMLDFTNTHGLTGNVSFGGATDYADLNGVSAAAYGDLVVALATTPPVPPNPLITPTVGAAGAGLNAVTLPDPGNVLCGEGQLMFARVAWGAPSPALGAQFLRYDLERSEDGGTTWARIAQVALEATLRFDDYEALRNTNLLYRVRAVRTDGAVSGWSTTPTPVQCTMLGSSVLLTSNTMPSLSTGHILLGGQYEYTFLSAQDVVFARAHGRDYQLAFSPLEQRGRSWSFALLIHTDGQAATRDIHRPAPEGGQGMRAFGRIRALAEADLPYVCVLTPDGERLFAKVQVPSGSRSEPQRLYVARVVVTEVAASPTVVAA